MIQASDSRAVGRLGGRGPLSGTRSSTRLACLLSNKWRRPRKVGLVDSIWSRNCL